MDDFGDIASQAAKRKFGERARIEAREMSIALGSGGRWMAVVLLDGHIAQTQRGATLTDALRKLARKLMSEHASMADADRALQDRAAMLGLNAR